MTLKQRPLRWTDLPIDRRRRLVVLISTLIRQRLSVDREACHEHGGEAFDARSGAGEDPSPPLRSPCGRMTTAISGRPARGRTSGKTGGGSAFFAPLTRRPLIPWEDGSAR